MANLNSPGTVEYAVRHAMDNLGAPAVARVLGCSVSTLYKATSVPPNRTLPEITIRQAAELARLLAERHQVRQRRTVGRTVEHFTAVIERAAGPPVVRTEDVHAAMTLATAELGRLADAVAGGGGSGDRRGPGLDRVSLVAQLADRAKSAIADVVEIVVHRVRLARGEVSDLVVDPADDRRG